MNYESIHPIMKISLDLQSIPQYGLNVYSTSLHMCVCVCVREREREEVQCTMTQVHEDKFTTLVTLRAQ